MNLTLEERKKAIELGSRLYQETDISQCWNLVMQGLSQLLGLTRIHGFRTSVDDDSLIRVEIEGVGRNVGLEEGLVSLCERTRRAIVLDSASDDTRFVPAIDDPPSRGDERIYMAPVLDTAENFHGLIVLVREPSDSPFGDQEEWVVGEVLSQLANAAVQLRKLAVVDTGLERKEKRRQDRLGQGIFRSEAVQHHFRHARYGSTIAVPDVGLRVTVAIVVAVFMTALGFLMLGQTVEHVVGRARVVSSSRKMVFSQSSGVVREILVQPGQSVSSGQLLVQLDDSEEKNNYELHKEIFERELALSMTNLNQSMNHREQVTKFRIAMEVAKQKFEAKRLKSPIAGIVGVLRVNAGTRIQEGQVVTSVTPGEGVFDVEIVVSGHSLPRLSKSMTFHFEPEGFRAVRVEGHLTEVAKEAIANIDATYIGWDSHILKGEYERGMGFLKGRLHVDNFSFDGKNYRLHHGMQGHWQAATTKQPLLFSLVPGLRTLAGGDAD